MSDASDTQNTKVGIEQGGDVIYVKSGGLIRVDAGGSITVNGVTIDADTLAVNGLEASSEELNLLDDAPADVDIELAAGAADTLTATLTVKNAAGDAIEAVHMLEWWISEAATGIGLTADTYSGDVTTTTGTEYQQIVDKKHYTGLTDANGVLVISAVASAKPADQYIAVKHPLTGKVLVSAASGANWGA
ncbi:MAG: hypothetical protein K9G48_08550 [Reyranella sp.]|nr:hypothetical protein [Reyranella sp.]